MKIAIIGAGAFGSALGNVLIKNGYSVDYYDHKMEDVTLPMVTNGASYIVLAVPSKAAPAVLPDLPKDKPLIIATKGFLTDEIFRDFNDYMVISGPGFANDIMDGKETILTATDYRAIDLFATDYLKFDYTDDKKGVLMCGALKNVYAILAGYYNLERDTTDWRCFITEVSEEIQALLSANGANPDTFKLVCGIGDLELTCGLPSRNYEYGLILREHSDARPGKTVEGLSTLEKIKNHTIIVPEQAKHLQACMANFKI